MGTLFATTVANAKPAEKDYKLTDGAGLYSNHCKIDPLGARMGSRLKSNLD